MSEWRAWGGYASHQRMHGMHQVQFPSGPMTTAIEVVPLTSTQQYKSVGVPTPKVPLMPGVILEHLEKGGCAWMTSDEIGRREEETALIQPSYKRHDTTQGRDPVEVFGVRTFDIDYDTTDIGDIKKQILAALSQEGVNGAQGIRMLDVLKERGGQPTTELLNRVLTLCKSHRSAEDARAAFTSHNGKELSDMQTFRTLSDIARWCGCAQTAMLVHTGIKESHHLENKDKDPTIITNLVTALLAPDALVKTNLSKDVTGTMLSEVLKIYSSLKGLPQLPVEQLQSATLWLASLGRKAEAISFYESHCHNNTTPFTISTYEKLLEAAEEVNFSLIPKILSKIKSSNLTLGKQRQFKLLHALYCRPEYINESRMIYKMLTDDVPPNEVDLETMALYIAAEGLSKSSGSCAIDCNEKSETLNTLWEGLHQRAGTTLKDAVDSKVLTNTMLGLMCNCLRDKNSFDGISSLLSLAAQFDTITGNSTKPLSELIAHLSSGYVTPSTRSNVADWKQSSLLAVFRNRNIDEWAFKILCKDLKGGDAALGFWIRYTAGVFAATDEKENESNSNKKDDTNSNDSDPDAALLKLLEGDSDSEEEDSGATFSLFTPLLASELLGSASYLVVLDTSACVSIFSDPVKRSRFNRLGKYSPTTVKCVVSFPTLLTLRCQHEEVLVELLNSFVSAAPGVPNLVPLPISMVYDVATNPFRVRPRKRKSLSASTISSEPPPSLSTATDMLMATLYRFQGIGSEYPSKLVLCTSDLDTYKAALDNKIICLRDSELLYGSEGG